MDMTITISAVRKEKAGVMDWYWYDGISSVNQNRKKRWSQEALIQAISDGITVQAANGITVETVDELNVIYR